MSRNKKKRDKKYRGADAKPTENVVRVHKVAAVARSDRAQWFYDHRKMLKRVTIIAVVAAAVIILIVQGIIALSR